MSAMLEAPATVARGRVKKWEKCKRRLLALRSMVIEIKRNGKTVTIIHNVPPKVSTTRLQWLAHRMNGGFLGSFENMRDVKRSSRIIRANFSA